MTNPNLKSAIWILDRSGSMRNLTEDVIGGFESFIEKTKKETEFVTEVTAILFDDEYESTYLCEKDLEKCSLEDKYYTRGMTALYDAVGKTIKDVGRNLAARKEENRPCEVTVFIVTDGMENASQEFDSCKIRDMIKHQESKYNWQFNFIGTNQDSFLSADQLGININNVSNYHNSSKGMDAVFGAASMKMAKRAMSTSAAYAACFDSNEI